jgi:lipid-binding SYLF domain-containing protein
VIGDSLINTLPFNFSGTESAMRRVIAVAVASVFIAGCAGTTGDQPADPAPASRLTAAERETEREARLALRDEALERLYELQPEARKGIESAPGYAVFDVSSVFIVLFVGQRGRGVLIDNATKKHTFMTSSRAGTGPGAGTTRVFQIFVFKVRSAMDQFVLAGGLGGDVGASAGIGAGGIVRSFNPQIDIYQIPQSGFAVQANWGGTVFSVDRDLQ